MADACFRLNDVMKAVDNCVAEVIESVAELDEKLSKPADSMTIRDKLNYRKLLCEREKLVTLCRLQDTVREIADSTPVQHGLPRR